MWEAMIGHAVWGAVPLVLLVAALRPSSHKGELEFRARYGLDGAPDTEAELRRLLERTRAFRLIGAALGLSVDPLLALTGIQPPEVGLLWGLTGYLCGEVIATITPGIAASGPRRASLTPRRPADYLSRLALLTPAASAGIGLIAVVVYLIEPRRLEPTFTSTPYAIIPCVLAAGLTYAAISVVVRRRQPMTTPDLVALDDSLRAQCTHTAAAVGGGVALFGAGLCLVAMGGWAAPDWLHLSGGIAGLILVMLAISAWGYRTSAWRVRRAVET